MSFLRQPAPAMPVPTPDAAAMAAAGSTAWSDFGTFFTNLKYNPDELIGRKGPHIYRRMMLDEQVKSAIQFRRSAVTGRDWYFALDHEAYGLTEDEATRRCQVCTDMLYNYKGTWQSGLNKIMKAMWQGFSSRSR